MTFFFNRKLRNCRGSFLTMVSFLIIPLVGLTVLGVDISMLYLYKLQSENISAMSSLAGIKAFSRFIGVNGTTRAEAIEMAKKVAIETAKRNSITRLKGEFILSADDITFGFYDTLSSKYSFTPSRTEEDVLNSIKITTRINPSMNITGSVFIIADLFKNALGLNIPTLKLKSDFYTTFRALNVVLILDVSASMFARTYRKPQNCADPNYPSAKSRHFQTIATEVELPPCIGPVNDEVGVVTPEPAYGVYQTILEKLLTGNKALFSGLYRAGLIAFETTAYVPGPDGNHIMMEPDVKLLPFSLNNVALLQENIEKTMAAWVSYAQNRADDPNAAWQAIVSDQYAFPGGLTPFAPGGTIASGNTNIGDAIALANKQISDVNRATSLQSKSIIILLTDGQPNCSRLGNNPAGALTCKATGNENAASVYAKSQALKSKNLDIQIHSIFFATDDADTCYEQGIDGGYPFLSPQDTLSRYVSDPTGGKVYCAKNIAELEKIAEDLKTDQGLVMVPIPEDSASQNYEVDYSKDKAQKNPNKFRN